MAKTTHRILLAKIYLSKGGGALPKLLECLRQRVVLTVSAFVFEIPAKICYLLLISIRVEAHDLVVRAVARGRGITGSKF